MKNRIFCFVLCLFFFLGTSALKGNNTVLNNLKCEYATGDAMNSHNHPMMGSVDTWFYKYVLGIHPDSRYPGFSQFVIKPVIFDDLTFAEGELNTVKGLVKVAWRKNSSRLNMNVSIPANTTAIVYLPAKTAKAVTENGTAISKLSVLDILSEEDGYVALRAGSGNYRFEIK